MKIKDIVAITILVLIILGIITFPIYAFVRNWQECRANDFSRFYCLTTNN